MKHSSIGFLFLMFICGCSFAQPSFRYKRRIAETKAEGWYSLTLPGEMFQHLNRTLTDLRLYSLNGNDTTEIPYLLRIHDRDVIEEEVRLPLFNTSQSDGKLFLTFELQPSQKVNVLRLDFEEQNYFGHVTLEGSDDRLGWFEIAKDERIVSIQKEGNDYKLSSIRFPLSSYRYLRMSISADTRLTFKEASFAYDSIRPGNYRDIPLNWQVKTDKDNRFTVVDIRMTEYSPVSMLNVQVDNNMDYYRHFALAYVRDSTQTQKGWIRRYESVRDGYLTSFEGNAFDFPVVFSRDLRLVIEDRDNAPLNIKEVTATGPKVTIVSYMKPGDNFMFYGAGYMQEPSYDLAHFQNKIPDSLAVAALGSPETIGAEESKGTPLFENPIWLWSIMGIMIVGLGFFSMKMMRK